MAKGLGLTTATGYILGDTTLQCGITSTYIIHNYGMLVYISNRRILHNLCVLLVYYMVDCTCPLYSVLHWLLYFLFCSVKGEVSVRVPWKWISFLLVFWWGTQSVEVNRGMQRFGEIWSRLCVQGLLHTSLVLYVCVCACVLCVFVHVCCVCLCMCTCTNCMLPNIPSLLRGAHHAWSSCCTL